MTSEIAAAVQPDRAVPRRAPDTRSLNVRIVRWIGRMPLQGREPTRWLIRLCHDATDRPSRLRARRYLRRAAAMNVVRHVVPLPFGVLATVDYDALAAHPGLSGLWVAAGTCTALLTVVSALAAYGQACVHLRLARRIRAGLREPGPGRPDIDPAPRDDVPPPVKVTRSGTYLRDRAFTRVLVLCALVTVPPPVLIRLAHLT